LPHPRSWISLDGATPGNIERFLDDGTLSKKRGLGLLIKRGVMAERNFTVTPSLTAPAHIAIATGSTAAKNDILANSFHLLASPFARNISGFSAPIGGYLFSPMGPRRARTRVPSPCGWRCELLEKRS